MEGINYEPKRWVYFSLIDGGIGFPLNISGRVLPVAVGFNSAGGPGIGTSLFDIVYSYKWEAEIYNNKLFIKAPGGAILPLYFYSMNYINFKGVNFGKKTYFLARPAFYFFFGFSTWLFSPFYTRIGAGISYTLNPFIAFIIEAGYTRGYINYRDSKKDDIIIFFESPFISLRISILGGFEGI